METAVIAVQTGPYIVAPVAVLVVLALLWISLEFMYWLGYQEGRQHRKRDEQ